MTMPAAQAAEPLGPSRRVTLAEYFEIAEKMPTRCEYRGGTAVCMPGGTESHSIATVNFASAVVYRLRGGPCRTYSPDQRIGVRRLTHFMYPDLSVVCGPSELDPRDPTGHTVLNPRLVGEVLSPSTESYDRGRKFERYMQIDSLQEYVLVSQDRPRIETLFRQPDGTWSLAFAAGLDASVRLRSLLIDVPLAEVYAGVTFPPPPADEVELPDVPPPT